jgi:urease accessory protein
MRRAIERFPAGDWPRARAVDVLTLDFDERHRRRIRLVSDAGGPVLLDLREAVAMADGDGLRCDDGAWLLVHAAPEALVEVSCAEPLALARIAWHLGNRHLPTELVGERLRIRPDYVIEEMLRGLGATVVAITAPFQPEGGAYAHIHRDFARALDHAH